MQLTNTYKGYTISYDGRSFEILLDEVVQTSRPKDLEACITWIDKKLKEEFVRTSVLVDSWSSGAKVAEATSIVDDRAWVVYPDGKREMVSCKDLKLLSDNNLTKIREFEELEKQAKELTKQAKSLRASLETFDVNSMIVRKQ